MPGSYGPGKGVTMDTSRFNITDTIGTTEETPKSYSAVIGRVSRGKFGGLKSVEKDRERFTASLAVNVEGNREYVQCVAWRQAALAMHELPDGVMIKAVGYFKEREKQSGGTVNEFHVKAFEEIK